MIGKAGAKTMGLNCAMGNTKITFVEEGRLKRPYFIIIKITLGKVLLMTLRNDVE